MKIITLASLSLGMLTLGGCAAGPSVASMGPGSDAAYIKDNRNRAAAITSDAELAQHRRQRQNTLEEMQLEKAKQDRTIDAIKMPFEILRAIR